MFKIQNDVREQKLSTKEVKEEKYYIRKVAKKLEI